MHLPQTTRDRNRRPDTQTVEDLLYPTTVAHDGPRQPVESKPLKLDQCDESLITLIDRYVDRLRLPTECLWITTDRAVYGDWLGRKVPSAYGGAYCFIRNRNLHAILIHLDRVDLNQTHGLEVVVAEELVHMRDHLDGDRRRHAKHGHDRIACRVAELTGATLEEIRSALLPVKQRPHRYIYECPGCGVRVPRRKSGTWSCRGCSPRFDRRYVLQIVEQLN